MHGVILDSEEEDITEEVTTQQWFQSRRSFTHFIVGLVLILGIFILPIIQRYPFGVDWIGFAILSGQIVETGSLNLPVLIQDIGHILRHFLHCLHGCKALLESMRVVLFLNWVIIL